MADPILSVVIPIKNEALNIDALCLELREVLDAWGKPYEILLVDDGSTDDSLAVMQRVQAKGAPIRVIAFERNFGQTAAFAAGFAHARGQLIATADGDRQNDPHDLPAMIDRLESGGFGLVVGWRKDRQDARWSRRLPSQIANGLITLVTGVRLHDSGCSLKVFRADVAKNLQLFGELHRFLPALASQQGVTIAEQVVDHRPRVAGQSKYGLSRTFRVIRDLVMIRCVLKRVQPLRLVGVWSAAATILGVALLGDVMLGLATGGQLSWLLMISGAVLAGAGVLLLVLGLVVEEQLRSYRDSKARPIYLIRFVVEPVA